MIQRGEPEAVDPDERLGEAIEAYLAKQAAFAAFLSARGGLDSSHGDGAARLLHLAA